MELIVDFSVYIDMKQLDKLVFVGAIDENNLGYGKEKAISWLVVICRWARGYDWPIY